MAAMWASCGTHIDTRKFWMMLRTSLSVVVGRTESKRCWRTAPRKLLIAVAILMLSSMGVAVSSSYLLMSMIHWLNWCPCWASIHLKFMMHCSCCARCSLEKRCLSCRHISKPFSMRCSCETWLFRAMAKLARYRWGRMMKRMMMIIMKTVAVTAAVVSVATEGMS